MPSLFEADVAPAHQLAVHLRLGLGVALDLLGRPCERLEGEGVEAGADFRVGDDLGHVGIDLRLDGRRHASYPSIPSICTSSNTRSGNCARQTCRACSPLVAMNTSQSSRNNSFNTRILIRWSSTTSSFGRTLKCANHVCIVNSIKPNSAIHVPPPERPQSPRIAPERQSVRIADADPPGLARAALRCAQGLVNC